MPILRVVPYFMIMTALSCLNIVGAAESGTDEIDVRLYVTDLGPTEFGSVSVFDSAAFTPKLDVPVNPDDQLLIHIWARNNTASGIFLRVFQIDPRESSFPYSLFGIDIDTGDQPLDGVPNFWFDYSQLEPVGGDLGLFPAAGPTSTGPYSDSSNTLQGNPQIPVAQATFFSGASADPLLSPQILMPPSQWVHLGAMPITVPTGTASYSIDLLNISNNDLNFGAVINFGFGAEPGDPVTTFASAPAPTAQSRMHRWPSAVVSFCMMVCCNNSSGRPLSAVEMTS